MKKALLGTPELAAEKLYMQKSLVLAVKQPYILLVIFGVALALRLIAVDVPINTDETLWMERGASFARHLLAGEFAQTYQRHHPGVTNMWLTGSSLTLGCLWQKLSLDACLSATSFPIELWILPRVFQAIATATCMTIIYSLVQRLWSIPIALTALSLLMLEPFFLAYQRYLTTDALQSDLGTIGLLSMLVYLQRPLSQLVQKDGRSRVWLLLSGVTMGLSIMAKIPSIFFIPAVLAWMVAIELFSAEPFFRRGWLRQGIDFCLWLMTMGTTAILVWPALWSSPSGTIKHLLQGLREESARGVFFYMGELTDAAGLSFYPMVLLYRLSPILLLGLLIWAAVTLKSAVRRNWQQEIFLGLLLAGTAVWVLGLLSFSDSKVDRYVNLVIPLLTILAAVGWIRLGSRLAKVKSQPVLAAGLIGLVVIQAAFLVSYAPYYISYFNPVARLIYPVERVLMIGQGEGLEQAARWLNSSPKIKSMTVAAWYSRAFYPYFEGKTVSLPKSFSDDDTPETAVPELPEWLSADRLVLYINQYQRQLPDPELLKYFAPQPVLHTVQFKGLDYVKVYAGPMVTEADLATISVSQTVDIGKIQFDGYDVSRTQLRRDQNLQVTTYWEFSETLPAEATLTLTLKNSTGKVSVTTERLLGGYMAMDEVFLHRPLRESQSLSVEGLVPGEYALTASWEIPGEPQAQAPHELSLGLVNVG